MAKSIIKYGIILIFAGIIVLLAYVRYILPQVGKPEDITVELTPERIERGRYLANSVSVCMDCHSKRDWGKFSGPIVKGTLGQGGEEFNQSIGLPGDYFAKNLTPYHLGDWTDGEILRAISTGVNKDGKALFPIMPHPSYGKMDKEDLYSIIAYIRTLEPVKNDVPESHSVFPMNFIINLIPKKAEFTKLPDPSDTLEYGRYLVNAAACTDCHTRQVKGEPVPGMYLAGGFEFPLYTGGVVRSANITPDEETGIGGWAEDDFVFRFKVYADSTFTPFSISNGDFNSVMPWMMYSTMRESDLRSIYQYLMTVEPVNNVVTDFTP